MLHSIQVDIDPEILIRWDLNPAVRSNLVWYFNTDEEDTGRLIEIGVNSVAQGHQIPEYAIKPKRIQ